MFLNRFREKELAMYSENGGAPRSVPVIFNEVYAPVDADGIPFEDTVPTVWVADVDCPNLSNRDSFVIGGNTWRVDGPVKPDGYGMTAVKLKK